MNTRPIADVKSVTITSSPELTAAIEAASGQPGTITTLPAQSGEQPEYWRSVSIVDLSLPAKLAERLQESGIHTIGQLEDLRAKCYDSFGEWPKGIGKAKVTVIEDALLDWLTVNRDKAVFGELESGAATAAQDDTADGETSDDASDYYEAAADAAVEAAAAAEAAHVDGATEITPTPTDAEYAAAIANRALEIDDGKPDSLDDTLNAGYWDRGWNCFAGGEPLASCGLPASPSQDDFIRGYLAASKAGVSPASPAATTTKPVAELVDANEL